VIVATGSSPARSCWPGADVILDSFEDLEGTLPRHLL